MCLTFESHRYANFLQEDEIAFENVSKQRVGAPDDARKTCLLELFADHFVAMAKESNRKRSYGQGLMYVMQAENLLQLIGENFSLDIKQGSALIHVCATKTAPNGPFWKMDISRNCVDFPQ